MVDTGLEGKGWSFEGIFGGEDEGKMEYSALDDGQLGFYSGASACNGRDSMEEGWKEALGLEER